MTSWDRPEAGENTPPVILDWSVEPNEDPRGQVVAIQRDARDAFPSFSVAVQDLNNPDALEVLWLETDPTLRIQTDLQRDPAEGEQPNVRLFQHTFTPGPSPLIGCWKIVASACDGEHLRTNDGCEPGLFEARQPWYGCVFETSTTECDMGTCPP